MSDLSQEGLSLILPCLNEKDNILDLIRKILDETTDIDSIEIIVIDDGSTDGTIFQVRQLQESQDNIYLYVNRTRLGLAKSIRKGIEKSSKIIVAVMDTDGLHDPSYLPQMYESIINSDASMVIASRYVRGGKMKGMLYPKFSRYVNFAIRVITRSSVKDQLCGYYLAKRKLLLQIDKSKYKGFGEYFIWIVNELKDFGILEIPSIHETRKSGNRKSQRLTMLITYFKTAFAVRRARN